jgi:hypothetical protein
MLRSHGLDLKLTPARTRGVADSQFVRFGPNMGFLIAARIEDISKLLDIPPTGWVLEREEGDRRCGAATIPGSLAAARQGLYRGTESTVPTIATSIMQRLEWCREAYIQGAWRVSYRTDRQGQRGGGSHIAGQRARSWPCGTLYLSDETPCLDHWMEMYRGQIQETSHSQGATKPRRTDTRSV